MMTMSINPPGEAIVVPPWMARREFTIDVLKGYDGTNAIAVCDTSAHCLAFVGPDFPPGHRLASVPETDELAALFDEPPDEWFAPRVRGLVVGTVFAIQHGWPTARDGLAAMNTVLRGRGFLSRTALRFLQLLSPDMGSPLRAQSVLQEARAAFAEAIGRGRPGDETRAFFLQEIVCLARDNELALALPQHRDVNDTPLLILVQAMADIVVSRVYDAGASPVIRDRLAPFETGRLGWIDACERARKKIQNEKPLEIKESS